MDLNQLSLFLEVAKARNFADASDALGVERSTVSRSIAALENALGVQLFSRTTRQVALTSAGAAFLREVEPHVLALRGAAANASEKQGQPTGVIRLSAPVDMAVAFMPDVIAGFRARYPGVQVDLRVENRLSDLVGEGIDAALRVVYAPLPDSTLLAMKVSALEFHAYASPGYLLRKGYPESVEESARLDWLTLRGSAMKGFPQPQEKPGLVADDMLFFHRAALAGMGLAVLPTFLAEPDVAAGRLVAVLPERMHDHMELHLLHPPAKRLPRKVRAFCEYLVHYLKAHPLASPQRPLPHRL